MGAFPHGLAGTQSNNEKSPVHMDRAFRSLHAANSVGLEAETVVAGTGSAETEGIRNFAGGSGLIKASGGFGSGFTSNSACCNSGTDGQVGQSFLETLGNHILNGGFDFLLVDGNLAVESLQFLLSGGQVALALSSFPVRSVTCFSREPALPSKGARAATLAFRSATSAA